MSPEEVDRAVEKFHACDVDKSGSIELQELEQILGMLLGHKMKPFLIKSVAKMHFTEADRDKSGSIDLEEFLEVYAKIYKQHAL